MQASKSHTTRRAVLSGAAVLTVAAATGLPAGASDQPDAHLIALGRDMDRLVANEQALAAAERWEEWESALEATTAVVRQIEQIQAQTVEGLKVQARAVLWCHSGDSGFSLVCDQSTTDLRLSDRILHALLRMSAH